MFQQTNVLWASVIYTISTQIYEFENYWSNFDVCLSCHQLGGIQCSSRSVRFSKNTSWRTVFLNHRPWHIIKQIVVFSIHSTCGVPAGVANGSAFLLDNPDALHCFIHREVVSDFRHPHSCSSLRVWRRLKGVIARHESRVFIQLNFYVYY